MPKKIKPYLKTLDIKFKTHTHPPVFTCEQADKYNKNIKGVHSKNLSLKNRKSKTFYLLILPANKSLNIDELGKRLGEKLKFASEKDLKNILNTTPGSVSPFALINDKEHKIKVIIDREVWYADFVSFHPNINTETLELTSQDFNKYLRSLKNELILI